MASRCGDVNLITRDDIARLSGVSKTTVSRVLNNNGYVSKDNRDRVIKVIEETGFSPNPMARGLRNKETRQILFYISDILNPFYLEVYQGIDGYARENNYSIEITSHFDLEFIKQKRFDGVIMSDVDEQYGNQLKKLNIPIVAVSYGNNDLSVPLVSIDVENGARDLANYIADCGHQRVTCIASGVHRSDPRPQVFFNTLRERGLHDHNFELIYNNDDCPGFTRGYNATQALIEKGLNCTAIFYTNDNLAIGGMGALAQAGYRIPEDISVAGFDDILQSNFCLPPLTTVSIPKFQQGQEVVKLLLKIIKNDPASNLVLKSVMTVRGSVKSLI